MMASEKAQEHTPLLVSQESLSPSRHHGKASVGETILNLMKTCAGTGILGLPYSCQQGGILLFIVGLLAIAGWNAYAVQRLCSCLHYLPDDIEEDEEEVVAASLPQSSKRRALPPEGTSTLGKVAWYAFGQVGLQALDIMMMILLFGIIVAYESAIISFWSDTPLSLGPLVDAFGSALVMAFFALVPDLGALSKASAAGLSVLLATYFVIAGYGIRSYHYDGPLNFLPESLTGVSHWFGVCVFGFGVVPLTYNYQASMTEPDKMVYATLVALTGVALAYIIWGLSLYALYPDLEGEILHELPQTGILPILTRLAMVWVVLMTAPLLIVPCGELLEGKWQVHNRIIVRFGICLVSAAVAVLLPSFVEVLSLVGCACVGLVGFCVPPLLHLRLANRSASRAVLVTDVILLAWGITATVISTIYTIGRKSEG